MFAQRTNLWNFSFLTRKVLFTSPWCYIHLRFLNRGKSEIPKDRGHKVEEVVGVDTLVALLRVEGDHQQDEDEGEEEEAAHYQQLQK